MFLKVLGHLDGSGCELFHRLVASAEINAVKKFALKLHDFNIGEFAFVGFFEGEEDADSITAEMRHAVNELFHGVLED